LVDVNEDFVSLMDEEGNCRDDIKLPDYPDNFAREIRQQFETGKNYSVVVMSAMGHDQIVGIKEDQETKDKA
jgi:hypothetical protein